MVSPGAGWSWWPFLSMVLGPQIPRGCQGTPSISHVVGTQDPENALRFGSSLSPPSVPANPQVAGMAPLSVPRASRTHSCNRAGPESPLARRASGACGLPSATPPPSPGDTSSSQIPQTGSRAQPTQQTGRVLRGPYSLTPAGTGGGSVGKETPSSCRGTRQGPGAVGSSAPQHIVGVQ